jgi:hypothetical protein
MIMLMLKVSHEQQEAAVLGLLFVLRRTLSKGRKRRAIDHTRKGR